MPATKAQQKAVNKYMSANYDRINLTTPKGKRKLIQEHAKSHGESANEFINRAIKETMERDDAATSDDIEAIKTARAEYGRGETVSVDNIDRN